MLFLNSNHFMNVVSKDLKESQLELFVFVFEHLAYRIFWWERG